MSSDNGNPASDPATSSPATSSPMQHEIRTMRLADLAPNERNPRRIDPKNAKALRASIERWGLVEPLIWNKRTGQLVGGHQRRRQMLALGIEETNVVVVDIEEHEELALNVTLNNPHAQGRFDDDAIAEMLDELEGSMGGIEELARLGLEKLRIEELEPASEQRGDDENTNPKNSLYVIMVTVNEATYRAVKPEFDAMMQKHPETLTVEITRSGGRAGAT